VALENTGAAYFVATSVIIIPARYGSTRLAGKMLLAETGKPLIQHVYENAVRAKRPREVIVAADDERIRQAVLSFGGKCVMTRPDHPSGSDRIAEVARSLDCEVVLNVQGDEPEMDPRVMDEVIEALENDPGSVVSTAAVPITSDEELRSPNVVKVALDGAGRALYFSRAPIPYPRDGWPAGKILALKHLGIYAYRREFLLRYTRMSQTPLEKLEKLEQLRILENGLHIRVIVAGHDGRGIDTIEDYRRFVEKIKIEEKR
jgi:3-deoxy-manno-octulosonate cytidylyltransferase (CMP-KDO synthetase)